MSHDPSFAEVLTDPDRVRRVLKGRVVAALGRSNGRTHVVRVTVPVDTTDPFAWLNVQPTATKLFWCGRSNQVMIAGAGIADRCTGGSPLDYPAILQRLRVVLSADDPDVRYYGGIRFDHAQPPSDTWAPFQAYQFILPRFELRVDGEEARLTCNLYLPRDAAQRDRVLAAIDALACPSEPLTGTLPTPVSRHDAPDAEGWQRNIETALAAFRAGTMDKVVLARRAAFTFGEALDPLLLLKQLKASTPNCFHFLFQPDGERAFVGASPERLFRRDEREVRSEAVAGTRPRGETDASDARLREELRLSEKDQREHDYVRCSIRDTLDVLCEPLHVDDTASEMTLARAQHLVSRVHGTLHPGVTEIDLLRGLHPTPAVGGYPKKISKQAIREMEPFDRGWYAGPVGWISANASEFAVAIRSGLVHDRTLALYSGAGIVEGSRSEAEWMEIEHKIGDFVQVLGLDLREADA